MLAYAIGFGPPSARRFLARHFEVGQHSKGWRELIWTRDASRAEKFSSIESAQDFGLQFLIHGDWAVVGIPPSGVPDQGFNGSPAAMTALAA